MQFAGQFAGTTALVEDSTQPAERLAGFCYKYRIVAALPFHSKLPLAFFLFDRCLCSCLVFHLPLLNMAAMFNNSRRLLLAAVLLLAIAQASMETANDIKLQRGMEVHSKLVQEAPKLGASAPPLHAPSPSVVTPAPPKVVATPPKGAPAPPKVVATPPKGAPAPPVDCKSGCGVRCKLHSRPNVCLRACGTCCAKCKCVPPGQSGNREVCGSCYTEWKTHNNQTKCP